MGGVCAMNVEPWYRVAALLRMFHTPERSGGLGACAVAAAKKADPSVNSKTVTLCRILGAPFRLFDLSAKRLALQYNLRDAY